MLCSEAKPSSNAEIYYLHNLFPSTPKHSACTLLLTTILLRSLLAGLQLVEVPAADVQITLVGVHARPELRDLVFAHAGRVVRGAVRGAGIAVGDGLLSGFLGWGRRAAGEPAADGVADGGADCDTAGKSMLACGCLGVWRGKLTYAAVLAIWPKRPGPCDAWA